MELLNNFYSFQSAYLSLSNMPNKIEISLYFYKLLALEILGNFSGI